LRDAYVLGVSMTRFGKLLDKTLKDFAYETVWNVIHESKIDPHDIGIAFVGNAYAGLITGQESVRGQVVLRDVGINRIPIINVENACASSSTAFYLARNAVASGQCDLALAVGLEKLFCGEPGRAFDLVRY
jgi:acetyl-CoA acyltransferase